MADPITATVTAAQPLGPGSTLLELSVSEDKKVGFSGGQYVIVNTGTVLPDGRPVKRAYSVLSSDAEQNRFRLAVRSIGEGPGSNGMNRIDVGAKISFTGPWGKWRADPQDPAPALVFATDTGITAALGLIQGRAFQGKMADTTLVWCVEGEDYFFPGNLLRKWLPDPGPETLVEIISPVGRAERVEAALAVLRRALAQRVPGSAYLVGDGQVLPALVAELSGRGLPEALIRTEFFFNKPPRKEGA